MLVRFRKENHCDNNRCSCNCSGYNEWKSRIKPNRKCCNCGSEKKSESKCCPQYSKPLGTGFLIGSVGNYRCKNRNISRCYSIQRPGKKKKKCVGSKCRHEK